MCIVGSPIQCGSYDSRAGPCDVGSIAGWYTISPILDFDVILTLKNRGCKEENGKLHGLYEVRGVPVKPEVEEPKYTKLSEDKPDVSKRIGIGKGIITDPVNFDELDEKIAVLFEESALSDL